MTIFFKKTVTLTHSAEIFLDTILHKTVYFTLVNLMIAIETWFEIIFQVDAFECALTPYENTLWK